MSEHLESHRQDIPANIFLYQSDIPSVSYLNHNQAAKTPQIQSHAYREERRPIQPRDKPIITSDKTTS